jgi:hypothetical protein
MINYTASLSTLMADIVERVPTLSFIDIADLLVFARPGRTDAAGPFATCHSLMLPPSEPGYYFWRDCASGRITRRSEWFVRKSPVVTIDSRRIKYLISFALPRFCNQALDRTRKRHLYPGAEPWVAKLDTVVHELYHVDPQHVGLRPIERADGTFSPYCHDDRFYADVAAMVRTYLDSRPDPALSAFLRDDFDAIENRHGGIVSTTFRRFPSYPQRYIERASVQPVSDADSGSITIEPVRSSEVTAYTQADLHVRQFFSTALRRPRQRSTSKAA